MFPCKNIGPLPKTHLFTAINPLFSHFLLLLVEILLLTLCSAINNCLLDLQFYGSSWTKLLLLLFSSPFHLLCKWGKLIIYYGYLLMNVFHIRERSSPFNWVILSSNLFTPVILDALSSLKPLWLDRNFLQMERQLHRKNPKIGL